MFKQKFEIEFELSKNNPPLTEEEIKDYLNLDFIKNLIVKEIK